MRTGSSMVGALVRAAIDAKSRDLRHRYTYHDLARDSDTHWTLIGKVISGQRRPSPQVLTAWARALAPHLPLQEALLAAGHAPTDPEALRRAQAAICGDDALAGHNTPESVTRLARLADSAVAEALPAQENAHAGDGGHTEPIAYLTPFLLGSRHVSLVVRGDCMAPDVRAGELVIAHLDGIPEDGDLVIAEIDGQPQVRIYDARHGRLWARDDSQPTPLREAGAIIPVRAVQRMVRPRRRRGRRAP